MGLAPLGPVQRLKYCSNILIAKSEPYRSFEYCHHEVGYITADTRITRLGLNSLQCAKPHVDGASWITKFVRMDEVSQCCGVCITEFSSKRVDADILGSAEKCAMYHAEHHSDVLGEQR